ncbi:MAG: c-type cytochrome [Chloroflexota bacterium]
MKRSLIIGSGTIASILLVFAFVGTSYYSTVADIREQFVTVDTTDAYAYGETLFETRGCVFCHTLSDAASTAEVGPHLDGIGVRLSADEIRESIIDPNAVIAVTCPEEACEPDVMPPFGAVLDAAQTDALVAYLIAQ